MLPGGRQRRHGEAVPGRPAVRYLVCLAVAAVLAVPAAAEPNDRDLYRHWIDADGDCQDARQEVLISESIGPVTLDDRGCRVVAGQWFDFYTGQTYTDPSKLDIDHFIPLAEVHRSGGDRWSPERRQAYANDLSNPDTLIAVSAGANRSKGDKDPAGWLPPDDTFRCAYVERWLAVKERWGLTLDVREARAIIEKAKSCP